MTEMISVLGDAPWWRVLFPIYRTTGLLELDERCYLDTMEDYVKARNSPSTTRALPHFLMSMRKWSI